MTSVDDIHPISPASLLLLLTMKYCVLRREGVFTRERGATHSNREERQERESLGDFNVLPVWNVDSMHLCSVYIVCVCVMM